MDLFDNYLIDFLKDLPNTDLLKLSGLVKKVSLKKNEIYINEGVFQYKVFYIKKGLIRGYLNDEEGEEKTLFFRWEKEFGADPNCFFEKKPAKLTWVAIEETELLEINYQNIEDLSRKNIGLMRLRIFFNQKLLHRMYMRMESFILLNPENRFKELLNTHNDLCDRIPDKYLASFLGITPVSLSRIRKRILNEQNINIC